MAEGGIVWVVVDCGMHDKVSGFTFRMRVCLVSPRVFGDAFGIVSVVSFL